MAAAAARVLILGDGNFSFSLAAAKQLRDGGEAAQRVLAFLGLPAGDGRAVELVCTSFDTREQVLDKYPEFAQYCPQLDGLPCVRLMHRINAWELPLQFPGATFDAIVWNHPCVRRPY